MKEHIHANHNYNEAEEIASYTNMKHNQFLSKKVIRN